MTQPAAEQWSAHVQQSPTIVVNPQQHFEVGRAAAPIEAKKPKGTLAVVEAILRTTSVPMSVRQIVEMAGATLPTKSRRPDTVVARDLAMDIKNKGAESAFVRTSPGRYTMRALLRPVESA